MQSNHLVENHNLHKALSWLAVQDVTVIAFKYIPENNIQPVILIEPESTLMDGQELYNCVLKFKKGE